MNHQQIEDQIIRSARIEGWVAIVSLIAAACGYFLFPQAREVIGWIGLIVWGFYALLFLFQVGPRRSWLGAFLPGAVAFFFFDLGYWRVSPNNSFKPNSLRGSA